MDEPMMSIDDFCACHTVRRVDSTGVVDMIGHQQSYESIVKKIGNESQPSDAIFYYCSTNADWARGMGSEGFILVRGGAIIDQVVLRMN